MKNNNKRFKKLDLVELLGRGMNTMSPSQRRPRAFQSIARLIDEEFEKIPVRGIVIESN